MGTKEKTHALVPSRVRKGDLCPKRLQRLGLLVVLGGDGFGSDSGLLGRSSGCGSSSCVGLALGLGIEAADL